MSGLAPMRLFRRLPLLLAVLCSLQTFPARATELLDHADFAGPAGGHVADGWRDESTALPRPPDCAIVPEGPGAGPVQRLTLGPLQGGQCRLVQTVAPPQGLYRLQARVRVSVPVQVELLLRTLPRPWTTFGVLRETVLPGEWRAVTGYARVPAAQGALGFVILIDDPGTVWIAAASLQVVDEAGLTATERDRIERVLGPALPPVDETQLIAETDARILRNRTASLSINVVDAAGHPQIGATVRLEHLRHHFWFGAGFDWQFLATKQTEVDQRHYAAFMRLFNAASVQFYAAGYEPEPGAYRDDGFVRALEWLRDHRLRAGGNSLYWNMAAPPWLGAHAPSVGSLDQWMDRLMHHASPGILGQMESVQVFNEVVAWDRFRTPLTPVLGGGRKVAVISDFLRRFKTLNPHVDAMVNDYDSTPEYYHLLRGLLDEGAPLDGIGLQSHMHNGPWSVAQLWNIVNRLALLRRPVYFTELSVPSGAPRAFNFRQADPPWKTTPEGEAAQADYLELFYRLAYSHPAVAGITYWDYADRSAWLGCPTGLLRKDGVPKPAYWRLDHLINQAWRTNGTFETDENGRVVVPHAFEGDYRISAGGTELIQEHTTKRPLTAVLVLTN
jgi:GH35 family endo-1,4-beta-xylanase